MEEALDRIKALIDGVDDALREKCIESLQAFIISLEKPDDTLERIVRAPFELEGVKIGLNLGIFTYLSSSNSPRDVDALVRETGADPILLGRLLRYFSSVRLITEVDKDTFTANNVTKVLASEKGKNYVDVFYEMVNPTISKLPEFLERTGYMNPTDRYNLSLHDAFNWKGDLFSFLKADPRRQALFNRHMQVQRDLITNWQAMVNILESKQSAEAVLLVDVAGGVGHQCQRFRAHYPHIEGRIILQDLPEVIKDALPISGVEAMEHDIFDPQPIQAGAKFYYFRGVLHDFSDQNCKEILHRTFGAMGLDSAIVVDEMILPDRNVHWKATSVDLQMMANFGSQERTHSHWVKLIESTGLRVKEVLYHGLDAYQGVIIAVKADWMEASIAYE
ncbi:hypothetical protein FE257_001132 [Aspergillus nanangensis]|uniref:O-methyltransferase C-terminal domain-containing protein n=1 Tax=Aspergillus nanangensis TaxID=2582783 RepID=A0AAD4CU28_ASPNN|nr:hypothetical protein FE257_001132 [Aspergillus nanangensis]